LYGTSSKPKFSKIKVLQKRKGYHEKKKKILGKKSFLKWRLSRMEVFRNGSSPI